MALPMTVPTMTLHPSHAPLATLPCRAQFYPQHLCAGLIVDVRHNRGGNVDAWLLERLSRRAWAFFQPRVGSGYWGAPYAPPRGCHMVCLCDPQTQSNAEFFADGFRRMGLGPLVGMRTWGGGIWISFGHGLQDGSAVGVPEIGVYAPAGRGGGAEGLYAPGGLPAHSGETGGATSGTAGGAAGGDGAAAGVADGTEWIVEGRGVEPDVLVDNRPAETFYGSDAQLDAAVRMLLERIEAEPPTRPSPPPYPSR